METKEDKISKLLNKELKSFTGWSFKLKCSHFNETNTITLKHGVLILKESLLKHIKDIIYYPNSNEMAITFKEEFF